MANRPTGNKLKIIRGADKPYRMNPDEVEFDTLEEIPECPDWISVDGRKYWDRILPLLLNARVMSKADLEALEMACLLYGRIVQAAKAGVDLPAATVTQLRMFQESFGLTPISRAKLKSQPDDDGSKNKFARNGRKPA